MENGVDWQGAICIMAIVLGGLSGCVRLISLTATVADHRIERPDAAQQRAIVAGGRPLERVADGLVLAHAGALVVSGLLALRARARYSAHLRLAFRAGIPLVICSEAWSLSDHWSQRGLLSMPSGSGSNLRCVLIGVGLLWSVGWAALKIGLFAWAARYLGRDPESQAGC